MSERKTVNQSDALHGQRAQTISSTADRCPTTRDVSVGGDAQLNVNGVNSHADIREDEIVRVGTGGTENEIGGQVEVARSRAWGSPHDDIHDTLGDVLGQALNALIQDDTVIRTGPSGRIATQDAWL